VVAENWGGGGGGPAVRPVKGAGRELFVFIVGDVEPSFPREIFSDFLWFGEKTNKSRGETIVCAVPGFRGGLKFLVGGEFWIWVGASPGVGGGSWKKNKKPPAGVGGGLCWGAGRGGV